MILLMIFSVLLIIVAAYFALQNATPVTVAVLSYQFEGSLSVVLLVTLSIGILISLFMMTPLLIGKTWRMAKLKKRVKELEHKLDNIDRSSQREL